MNEKEWQVIGNQAKKVREELFNLHRMTTGKMPVGIVKNITNAIADVDRFKNLTEERMFKTGGPKDINIFYGSNLEKKSNFNEWIKQFKDDNNPLGDLARDIVADASFPSSNNYEECLKYLGSKISWSAVFEIFEKAWILYRAASFKDEGNSNG